MPSYTISRYGSSLITYSLRPSSRSLRDSMAANASRFSRVYTAPTGLFGELMMTALVFGVMAASMASTSSWKSGTWAGTSTHAHSAVSIHTLYSGKYGAITMTSSPGRVMAEMEMAKPAAAPAVRYTWSGEASMPKWRLMWSATACRTRGSPAAGV